MAVTMQRYDKDCFRILEGDRIAAFVLRLANGRWGLYSTSDRKLTDETWAKPEDAGHDFDSRPALRAAATS